jgi:hypothetical protein
MTDDTASIITLHQPQTKRAKTPAERSKAYRQRKKASVPALPVTAQVSTTVSECDKVAPATPVPPSTIASGAVTPSRARVAPILLTASAFTLAGVGMTMNGWFARSLGSSDFAGWLFLAIGVAADLIALVMPSCAARLWQVHQRTISLASWAVWATTFVFAVTAGIGFASTNIADVTLARASRITPAVQVAQAALADAMVARDRECKGGVGKFCRGRKAAVNERRQALDTTMQSVELTADPQADAAIRIVAWATHGVLKPTGDDFAMLRLVLFQRTLAVSFRSVQVFIHLTPLFR